MSGLEFGSPRPRCRIFPSDPEIRQFCEEVVRNGRILDLENSDGLPVFAPNRISVIPFWSSRRRVLSALRTMPEYAMYSVREEFSDEFLETIIPWLEEQAIHIGVNWSGENPVRCLVSAHDLLVGLQLCCEAHELENEFHRIRTPAKSRVGRSISIRIL